MNISSPESLDVAVAEVVRLKIRHTEAVAGMDADVAALQKIHQSKITDLLERISDGETAVQDYCTARRAELFPDKKSRETVTAVFGFELTPWRVEPLKKIKLAEIIERLKRLPWGKLYLRAPKVTLDREALLKDRERIKEQHCAQGGFQFAQDEQFFIRPKPETAADSAKDAA
jgi:phage host-nuclease inhibitor protein Gam